MAFATGTSLPLRGGNATSARCMHRPVRTSRMVRMATPLTTTPKPLHDRVFVRIDEAVSSTAGGLVLPSAATDKKEKTGVVVGVGRGRYSPEGVLEPMEVVVGDRVLWKNEFGSESVKIEGEDCIALRIPSIVAKWPAE